MQIRNKSSWITCVVCGKEAYGDAQLSLCDSCPAPSGHIKVEYSPLTIDGIHNDTGNVRWLTEEQIHDLSYNPIQYFTNKDLIDEMKRRNIGMKYSKEAIEDIVYNLSEEDINILWAEIRRRQIVKRPAFNQPKLKYVGTYMQVLTFKPPE